MTPPLAAPDHLVYATPDLESGIRRVEALLGTSALPGGVHPGRGTRNALIALEGGIYVEIVGIDPGQPPPDTARWFGLDDLTEPRLVTWAARTTDLEGVLARAGRVGVDLGAVGAGSRVLPDGSTLRWRATDPCAPRAGGVLPFFIDWGAGPHPSRGLRAAGVLEGLDVGHPEPERTRRSLSAWGLEAATGAAPTPSLGARIRTPRGTVALR